MTRAIRFFLKGVETLTDISGSAPTSKPHSNSVRISCMKGTGAVCAKSDFANITRDSRNVARDFYVAANRSIRSTSNGSKTKK